MSFAADAKKELLTLPASDCCRIAETSALFAVNGHLTISSNALRLSFTTTNISIARKVIQSVKRLYSVQVDITSKQQLKLKKQNQYIITLSEKVPTILNELSLMNDERGFAQGIDDMLLIKECDQRAYLRGAFLASGSINHPNSSNYHCEITVQSESLAEDLIELMNRYDLKAKMIPKRKQYMIYLKESEKIADFLRIIGATYALLDFEDVRIKRDFYNSITRVMNMELANQNKTLEAATNQLKQIAVLENLVDMTKIPETLHEAIFLRKTYPEASLTELSEMSRTHYNKEISKSGLNHRFRNIALIAKEVLDEFNE